ncbi:TolC family outer membrane protein [Sulfurimonas paralvinellae]|uniref:TolC family outer membrane protein n=1 Tax=Sulfurimonas paralvinellae TaxID=317658 RepID=A0A7M1B8L4_9BACT|nr:TolC family outer membrane protein [Sulfurimonas paralvinellae]QOP46044.1 TolC family outer membrane protein [Sulfurimonas paralvinellae]
MLKNIIALSFLTCVSYSQTLQESLEEVLQTNPTIQERLQNYNATKQDITNAKSGYYPSLDLKLGAGQEKIERQYTTTDYSAYETSLNYTQNIFNGFGTTALVEGQEYRAVAAAYSYVEKVNATSSELVNTYLEAMKNEELLKTAQENVAIDQEIFNKVKKLYKAGLTTLSEVKKIESSLALAKSNLVVQENTLLNASYNLEKVLGHTLDASAMQKPNLDNVNFPQSQEEALAFAFKHNPSLLANEYNLKVAKATNKENKAKYYPKIDLDISQAYNHNVSGIKGKDDEFRAMAYLSYNIFNGFSDQSSIEKSYSQIQQQFENKRSVKREIVQSLKLSWAAQEKLQEQLIHLQEYKKFSNKTLILYSKEYDLGRRSLLDLLSAQNDFIRSKAQIITTQYSILNAKYKILNTMGVLVTSIMQDNKVVYSKVDLSGEK